VSRRELSARTPGRQDARTRKGPIMASWRPGVSILRSSPERQGRLPKPLDEAVVAQVQADEPPDVPGRLQLPAQNPEVASELAAHAGLGGGDAGRVPPGPELEGPAAARGGLDAHGHAWVLEPNVEPVR